MSVEQQKAMMRFNVLKQIAYQKAVPVTPR